MFWCSTTRLRNRGEMALFPLIPAQPPQICSSRKTELHWIYQSWFCLFVCGVFVLLLTSGEHDQLLHGQKLYSTVFIASSIQLHRSSGFLIHSPCIQGSLKKSSTFSLNFWSPQWLCIRLWKYMTQLPYRKKATKRCFTGHWPVPSDIDLTSPSFGISTVHITAIGIKHDIRTIMHHQLLTCAACSATTNQLHCLTALRGMWWSEETITDRFLVLRT